MNINYLGWIISDIKQKGMEYLLIIHIFSTNFAINLLYLHILKAKQTM